MLLESRNNSIENSAMAVSQPQILITLQQNVFFLRVNKYRMRRNTNKQNLEVPDLLSRNMQTKTPTFIRTHILTGKTLIGEFARKLTNLAEIILFGRSFVVSVVRLPVYKKA